jgi:hypothetical protein
VRVDHRDMTYRHAVVWIDHVRAAIVDFTAADVHTTHLHPHDETPQLHRKSGKPGAGHLDDDVELFDRVVDALDGAEEILIVGPGLAKRAFRRHLAVHHPGVDGRVVGIETVNHPTDPQLLAYARKYFHRVDQLLGDR